MCGARTGNNGALNAALELQRSWTRGAECNAAAACTRAAFGLNKKIKQPQKHNKVLKFLEEFQISLSSLHSLSMEFCQGQIWHSCRKFVVNFIRYFLGHHTFNSQSLLLPVPLFNQPFNWCGFLPNFCVYKLTSSLG